MGNGRIDLHGLQRDLPLLFGAFEGKGPHIVEPIRQLDDDDPDVLAHGKEHLPDVLRLLLLFGGQGNLPQFGHAVYHQRHVRPELLADPFQRRIGILHHIMKQCGAQTVRIHPQPH